MTDSLIWKARPSLCLVVIAAALALAGCVAPAAYSDHRLSGHGYPDHAKAGDPFKGFKPDPCVPGAATCNLDVETSVFGQHCRVDWSFLNELKVMPGTRVTWTIAKSLYTIEFDAAKGIDIANASPDFIFVGRDAARTSFSWDASKKTTGKEHKYSVNLRWFKPGSDEGIPCDVFDPIIVNQS